MDSNSTTKQHSHSLPIKPTTTSTTSNTIGSQSAQGLSSSSIPRTTPSTSQHSYNNNNNNNNPMSFLPSKPSTLLTSTSTSSSSTSLPRKPVTNSSLPPKPSSIISTSTSSSTSTTSSSPPRSSSNSNHVINSFGLPSKPEFSSSSTTTTTTTNHNNHHHSNSTRRTTSSSSSSGTPPPPPREKEDEKPSIVKNEQEENSSSSLIPPEREGRGEESRDSKPVKIELVEDNYNNKKVEKFDEDEDKDKEEEISKPVVVEEMSRSSTTCQSATSSGSRSRSRSQTPLKKEEEEDSDEDPVVSNRKLAPTKTKTPRRKAGGATTPPLVPQLIPNLPSAESEASKTYQEISESIYFNKSLGNTHYYDPDNARCDCTFKPTSSSLGAGSEQSCGEYSGCMNRMLQMECEKGDCRCGENCQNQRFQNREYAPIEIVQTEKKGFGVRASKDLSADTFVYEYVGEVIGPAPFARKMKEYAQEGIKHFYFMALDKEVFIDATKKGGKGRFLNHSCNPNCQVAKWTVGKKMRMGIFTKRDILKDEELTFNYNVDRYGHLAQECFCGEPNCVGYIGGKTQTDIGGMDDLYIDALGIKDEVEALGLKGSKKKKGRKLDEDYNPTLVPIAPDEVPKVASAIRQALQTRRILTKLLERVEMTDDDEVQRQLLRLHGLSLMNNILKEYPKDNQVLNLDLTILTKWKFQTRNKIETSKIEDQIKLFVDYKDKDDDDDKISTMAKQLLASWSELSLGFRIPKAQRDGESDLKRPSHFDIDQLAKRARLEEQELLSPSSLDSNGHLENHRTKFVRPEANTTVVSLMRNSRKPLLPPGWTMLTSEQGKEYYRNDFNGKTQWEIPLKPASTLKDSEGGIGTPSKSSSSTSTSLTTNQIVLDAATLVAEAEKAAKEAKELEIKRLEMEEMEKKREKEERHRKKKQEKEEREREKKEKKVLGLFSGVVVSTMSKYRSQFEPDAFKKRAKEVTQILLDKEKKRPTFESDSYESLSSEKEAKVKSFVKDWVKKLLERKKTSSSSSTPGGRNSSSASGTSTPSRTITTSKPRPSILNFDSTSSASTPRLSGLEIEDETSPATPLTGPMDLDTPTTLNGDDKYNSTDDPSGTPRGTPPRHRFQHQDS
ncbi:hypothetical protein JCM5350_000836 [Sporobolomyces pararoseus]